MLSIKEQTYNIRDQTEVKPAARCYNLQRIVNPYTQDVLYVDCRKCPACLWKYSNELTARVSRECTQHRYSLFFTLTYDNDHLPIMERVCPSVYKLNRDYDRDGSVASKYLFTSSASKLGYKIPTRFACDAFAVVCKEDVQLWLKRLRSAINYQFKDLKENEKKIRYFICSEYGPTTERPHYHGILWTDCSTICRELPRLLRETWKNCSPSRIDAQLVNGSAPAYVAKYLAGFAHLPKVLCSKYTRPFHLASKDPVIGSFKTSREEVLDLLVNRVIETPRVSNGDVETFAYVLVSYQTLLRYFPPCQGFSLSDDNYKLSLYDKYERGKFLKRRDKVNKCYFESERRGYNYLDCSMSFKYQDYRFWKNIHELAYHPTCIPKRNRNGDVVGSMVVSLSPREIIHLMVMLFDSYRLYSLNTRLRSMEVLSESLDSDHLSFTLLAHYPNLISELPQFMTYDEWCFKSFHRGDYSFQMIMDDFGLSYGDLYDDDSMIRQDVLFKLQDIDINKKSRSDMIKKILESDRKKKFNELYNNFNCG